jgi:hypothetical protein
MKDSILSWAVVQFGEIGIQVYGIAISIALLYVVFIRQIYWKLVMEQA